ncbi:unnamed protein product [Pseudo-nitzschia multistriata]|uniref:Uncharacterized protein n=1 Tax=Pseudo-nitzschia multistriata TaxID=183589 RepID=A0A448ZIR5_9STRA|nr:unnamed protein product [Pseudo-nitzschia multistriata]
MFFQEKSLAAFLLLSSSSVANAALCYESPVCLATMGTPGSCVSTTQGRTYPVCCPSGATQTWDSSDDCTIGGDNTALPSGLNKCTETWDKCYAGGTLSSCNSQWGRTFNACCPDGATATWEPGTSCTSGGLKDTGDDDLAGSNVTDVMTEDSTDVVAEDSASPPSSLMTVTALGFAVAVVALAAF